MKTQNLTSRIQKAYAEIEAIEAGQSAIVMGWHVARTKGHDIYVDGRGPYTSQQAANIVNYQPPMS